MEYLKITRIAKIAMVLILCAAMMFMCVAPGFAVVGTGTIIASAVVAAMSSFGIGTLVSGMTASQLSDWVTSELNSWASSLNDTVSNLIPVSSIAVNPVGALTIMPVTAARIVTFVRWLATKYSVSAGGSPVEVVNTSFASNQPFVGDRVRHSLLSFNGNQMLSLYPYNNNPYYVFCYGYVNGSLQLCVCCIGYYESLNVRTYNSETQGVSGWSNYTYNSSLNVTYGVKSLTCSSYNLFIPQYSSIMDGLSALSGFVTNGASSVSLVPEGSIDYPDYVGNNEDEQPYVVDWGGSPGLTIDEAAQGIMNKVVSNDLVSDGSIAIDPDNASWPDIVEPVEVPNLENIFPFCIPFDIYHLYQALSAAPEAPRWEVPFVIPGLVNYTFVIDLSSFNTVAQIFRQMELICFCVGLALVTRRLIRG